MTNHKFGRIQIDNIHDKRNLVALCSICHFAFDWDEWTFIPEDATEWIHRIESAPQIIQEYNSQKNVVFRRLLLVPDPDSKAFQDTHYRSAFTDNPTRIWSGEPGVVVVRQTPLFLSQSTAKLQETLDNFNVLQSLWFAYQSSCSEGNCPICQNKSDGKQGKEDDKDDKDDSQDDDRNEENGEEDEEADGSTSSSRKSRKRISKRHPDSNGQQSPFQDVDVKKSTRASKYRRASIYRKASKPRKARKNLKNTERDWMTTTPYDESIPYSHRYGYTWANTTSNELMEMWQVYRKPVDDQSTS